MDILNEHQDMHARTMLEWGDALQVKSTKMHVL